MDKNCNSRCYYNQYRFGGGYPTWKIPLYKSFAIENQKIYLIRTNSHDLKTLEKVKEILKQNNVNKVDFLFIDGDHTYEGVKRDFEMYSNLLRSDNHSFIQAEECLSLKADLNKDWNGVDIIAFHDIVPGPEENVGGVPKFWKEIKSKFICKEIVKDWNQGGYGIGILYV